MSPATSASIAALVLVAGGLAVLAVRRLRAGLRRIWRHLWPHNW